MSRARGSTKTENENDFNSFFNDLLQQSLVASIVKQFDGDNNNLPDSGNSDNNIGNQEQQPKVFNQNVYEFNTKLDKQDRIMKSIIFSDVHKDVVESLISKSSVSPSSKSYNALRRQTEIAGASDNENIEYEFMQAARNFNYSAQSNPMDPTARRNSLSKQRKSQVNVGGSNKEIRQAARLKSVHTLPNKIGRLTSLAFITPTTTQQPSHDASNRSSANRLNRPSTAKTNVSTRIGSSGTYSTKSSLSPIKSNNKYTSSAASTVTTASSSLSLARSSSSRIADLVLDKCRAINDSSLDASNTNDNSLESFSSSSFGRSRHFDEDSFLTPSFRVLKYNLKDNRQLEMAKLDIYKRYASVDAPVLRAISTKSFNSFERRRHHTPSLVV